MKKQILNIGNIVGAMFFVIVAVIAFTIRRHSSMCAGAAILIAVIVFHKLLFSKRVPLQDAKFSVSRLYLICTLVMLTAHLIIAFSINYVPVTDASYMDTICRNFVEGREMYAGLDEIHTYYIERYSNQWGIFLIQSLVYKISHLICGRIPHIIMPLVNIAGFQITYFFIYKLACRVFTSDKLKKLCLILIALNPVLYGYSVIFYTDTLSMPFVAASLYFGVSALQCKDSDKKRFVLYSCLAALLIGAGYSIKGSVGIIAVALVIYALFTVGIKRSLVFLTVIIVGFAGIKVSVKQIMLTTGAVTEQNIETYGFPMSHWVMMGLQGRGGYDHASFLLTFNQPDVQARHENSIKLIRSTLSEYGVSGLSWHLIEKLSYTWSGGAYQITWQMSQTPDSPLQRLFTSSKIYLVLCFMFHGLVLIFMSASYIFSAIRRRVDAMFVIRLTALGLGLFLLIWETRSRYMLNMLPLFMMLAVDGMEQLLQFADKIKPLSVKKK